MGEMNIMKNKLIGIFVCLLLIVTIFPVSGNQILDSNLVQLPLGNTLYVGGSGPDNYTRIQDAIDNASNGDTVFVYDDSSPYYENVVVNESITLRGENKKTTVIDGRNIDFVVNVSANGVTITGFKIVKSGTGVDGFAGISVDHASNCYINENIIEDNYDGIFVYYSSHCTITGNIVNNNYYMGINVGYYSHYTHIANNKVTNTSIFGINIHKINDSVICEMNHIERTGYTGIHLYKSNSNTIRYNNFIRNRHHAYYVDCSNNWSGNFWNRPRIFPKVIFGRKDTFDRFYNMIDFDWHPAREPYDILPLGV